MSLEEEKKIRRRHVQYQQVLESSSEELEESLYNKLLLIEHNIKSIVTEFVKEIRSLDYESLKNIVKMYDIDVVNVDDISRYRPIVEDHYKVEDESILDVDYVEIKNVEKSIEEYYLGQKIIEKALISEW